MDMDSSEDFLHMRDEDLIKAWATTDMTSLESRDAIVRAMLKRDIRPTTWTRDYERRAGLYSAIDDPDFSTRLFQKTEFFQHTSEVVPDDICTREAGFQNTPVQRLVARFLHPATPYLGLLLDHGVGVGKTCSAVTVAETFLSLLPYNKVTILCPQSIRSGFLRTIFDADKLKALPPRQAQLRGEMWESQQCTGMTYLRLTGTANEPDVAVIEKEVEAAVRKRYRIMGYLQFANWVLDRLKTEVPKNLEGEARKEAEDALLMSIFSDHLLIVDEAHNLRDIEGGSGRGRGARAAAAAAELPAETAAQEAETPIAGAAADAAEGKRLTPVLRRILQVSEGMRLLLMTATPMYNTAPEILFLLNLLLLNDTKDEGKLLKPRDIFTADGRLLDGGQAALRGVCGRYISYMRGENPSSFPLRLSPPLKSEQPRAPLHMAGAELFAAYPTRSISRSEGRVTWTGSVKRILSMLPLVVHPVAGTYAGLELHKLLKAHTERDVGNEEDAADDDVGVSDFILNRATQVANMAYPDGSFGSDGWDVFLRAVSGGGRLRQFKWQAPYLEDDDWTPTIDDIFGPEHFHTYSAKGAAIAGSLKRAKGMCFTFSRYVKAGALPLALALERAGWTRILGDGSPQPLVPDAKPRPARQCAFCEHRENQRHEGHTFAPANFILLTGDETLTPDFKGALRYANTLRGDFEVRGGKVKAIIGSQITAEGLDLKCIRENHLMDGWYHLNRVEQVIGRAVRYCSHAALPKEDRNCLIYLHAAMIPEYETADLYAYRLAARKAIPIGQVQRIIKETAWDCTMNKAAVMLRGLPRQRVVDAQGRVMARYNPNDQPYTSICDFQDSCEYTCTVLDNKGGTNMSTYEATNAVQRFAEKANKMRERFRDEAALSVGDVRQIYADMPWEIAVTGVLELLDNPHFVVERNDGARGTLHLQNGYIVFQPLSVTDYEIPMALRYGRAYGRLPRYMDLPRKSIFSGERPAPPAAAAVTPTEKPKAMVAKTAAAAAAGPAALLAEVSEWQEHVGQIFAAASASHSKEPLTIPTRLTSGPFYDGLRWVLWNFRGIPEMGTVALRWYMDTVWSPQERAAFVAFLVTTPDAPTDLLSLFQPVEVFRGALTGFHVFDTAKQKVVAHCVGLEEGSKEARVCPSNLLADVEIQTGKPVDKKDGTGELFGFLSFNKKESKVLFKTVNKEENSFRGAQCDNTTNLVPHEYRIKLIQEALERSLGEGAAILDVVLDAHPDRRAEKGERQKRQISGAYKHVNDLPKNHMCRYMEFLLRWMDEKRVNGKRWYLSLVDSVRAGL